MHRCARSLLPTSFSHTLRRLNSFHYRKVRPTAEDASNPLQKPFVMDAGALHVVSVPIGNLKDFTFRAVDVLQSTDYIVTSDRPATKALLDLIGIPSQGRLIHYSAQNATATADKLVEMLKGGRSMAFVTTSGTPCVGDVGAELVQAMLRSGVRVTAVPGASAVMCALVACGVSQSPYEKVSAPFSSPHEAQRMTGSFYFGNVLPASYAARSRILRNVVGPAEHPCIFYEVPRRLVTVLSDIAAILPGRRVYVSHELTRLNESVHGDRVERLLAFYRRTESHRLLKLGQLVIVVAGASPADTERWMQTIAERRLKFFPLLDSGSLTTSEATAPAAKAAAKKSKKKLKKKKIPQSRQAKRRRSLLRRIRLEKERLRLELVSNSQQTA